MDYLQIETSQTVKWTEWTVLRNSKQAETNHLFMESIKSRGKNFNNSTGLPFRECFLAHNFVEKFTSR